MEWPKRVLMVTPAQFDVEYAINPHMVDESGNLKKVNRPMAQKQWETLKHTFEKVGMEVITIEGQQGFPDMVFCANQTFPYYKECQTKIVLSQMHSPQRQPEVAFFKTWADSEGIPTQFSHQLFEGMGDALWNYESGQVYGGYGFRTSPEVYETLEKTIDQKIITFELKDDRFYHLDTCLAILGKETAAYVEEAFTLEGLATLESQFENLLRVPLQEATEQLACNMCTPNGRDVILQKGANQTVSQLKKLGYSVHEVDTSEFIKSGGSVFCMKMLIW